MNRKALLLYLLAIAMPLTTWCQAIRPNEQEVFIQPDSMRIYGTFLKPVNSFNGDVVLLIAGSGPTDRNGNQPAMRTNTYQQLADSLATRGIASLRYDKRFIGKSAGKIDEHKLRFNDNVVVAKAFFKWLQDEPSIRRIFIVGHSEGSTVGMLLATEVNASGFASIAGPGFPADVVLRKQLSNLPPALKTDALAGIDSLKAGHTVQNVNQALFALLRPSVQQYLISWFQHDPGQIIKRLRIPVLIVQGTTDIQVSMEDADGLATHCHSCNKVLIEGMNHVLKNAPLERAANIATYNQPDLPVVAGLVNALAGFIKGR